MKRFRLLSTLMQSDLTSQTEHTRQYLLMAEKITRDYQKQLIITAFKAAEKNLIAAKKYLKKDTPNITKAREYYEGAAEMAEKICNEKDLEHFLTIEQQKTLSETFSGYAEFLRWTTNTDSHPKIADLLNNALKLNPDNREALATRDDIKFTYRFT